MDDLLARDAGGAHGRPLPPPLPATRAPGRPAADPGRRAEHDANYEARRSEMAKLQSMLPKIATEARIVVWRAHPAMDVKHPKQRAPLSKILMSEWEDSGLQDESVLRAYLEEKHGPGRYFLEVRDARGSLIKDSPQWIIETTPGDDIEDDDDLPIPRRRGGRMSRHRRPAEDDLGYDDDDFETPGVQRANVGDLLMQNQQRQADAAATAAKSQGDVMSMMLMMQQQADQRRQELEEQRRREDREREDRRREEEARRADERKREEEQKREDERRRWEERSEERKREEDRRREEDRLRAERDREQMRLITEQSNKRAEMLLGLVTAGLPIVQKLLEPKPQQKPDTDPMAMMLLKSMLDKNSNQDSMASMLAGINEVNKMSSQMMGESMKSLFTTSQQIQSELTKQLMESIKERNNGDDDEDEEAGGGKMLGTIAEIVSGASKMVESMTGKGAQDPGTQQPQQGPWASQQAPAAIPPPHPIVAMGGLMKLIQEQRYANQGEYRQILQALITQMPQNVHQAVLAGDQAAIMSLCGPHFMREPELLAWIQQEGVADWIEKFMEDFRKMLIGLAQERQAQDDAQAQTPAPLDSADDQCDTGPGDDEGDGGDEEEEEEVDDDPV